MTMASYCHYFLSVDTEVKDMGCGQTERVKSWKDDPLECVGRRWLPARNWATVAFKPGPGMHSRAGQEAGRGSTEDKDNGRLLSLVPFTPAGRREQ